MILYMKKQMKWKFTAMFHVRVLSKRRLRRDAISFSIPFSPFENCQMIYHQLQSQTVKLSYELGFPVWIAKRKIFACLKNE